jgi:putative transposase
MAKTISLKAGSIVYFGTVEYEVLESASLTSIKVRDVSNGQIRVISLENISPQSADAAKVGTTPLDCLSPEDQVYALKEYGKIKEAIQKSLKGKDLKAIAKQNNLHVTTIYRKIRIYEETSSPAAFATKIHNRGGRGKPRIDQAVEDLIRLHFDGVAKDKHVDITKVSIESLFNDIKAKCRNLNLKHPAWGTVNTRLNNYMLEKKLERKRGRRKKSRRVTAGLAFPNANFPLDVVQIDHTPLDLILVDEQNREPIGRPYLSIAIDVYSRVIIGFCIMLDTPSIFSVGQLITHCILPKNDFLEKIGVKASWDFFGVMRTLLMDIPLQCFRRGNICRE